MAEQDLELEKEMEDIKLDELRTKGVARIVDRMISEAIRDGKFNDIEGKGKKLEEDYYSAHLSSQDPLERKLQSLMKDEGFLPEWVEIQAELDTKVKKLREDLHVEIVKIVKFNRDSTLGQIDLNLYVGEFLNKPKIKDNIATIHRLTKRHNYLCPTLLQRTSWSKQWSELIVNEEIKKAEESVK